MIQVSPIRILLVGTDAARASDIGAALSRLENQVVLITESSLDGARASLQREPVDVVLVHASGDHHIADVLAGMSVAPVIVLLGTEELATCEEHLRHGVWNILPIDPAGCWQSLLMPLIHLAVKQRATLTRARDELKDFMYIISHDFKAPLRGILSVSGWITTDYADLIDEDGRDMLKLLNQRANRITSMVDGVLEYSRIGRVSEELRISASKPCVEQALARFRSDPERAARVEITVDDTFPEVVIEPSRFTQVFELLLDNAARYAGSSPCHVHIGCQIVDGEAVFSVRDDGIGIAERDHQQVFRIFQRLNPDESPDSLGIGLTLAKRIVECQNGRIWVDASTHGGCSISFTASLSPDQQ